MLPVNILFLTFHRSSTVGDVARKVMGDVPISYIEGVGGTRVSEDDIVAVGKNDVSVSWLISRIPLTKYHCRSYLSRSDVRPVHLCTASPMQ